MRYRKPIDRAERFFELLAVLSSRSTQIRHDDVDHEIVQWLALLCAELGLDRSIIAPYLPEKSGFYTSSGWSNDGLPPEPTPMSPAAALVPWICGKVAAGETVAITSPDALPARATVDRAFLRGEATPKAMLVIPVIVGSHLLAGITFEDFHGERAWDRSLVAKLKLATDLLGNALERKRAAAEADRLRGAMESVGRFALLGETAAAMAHELSHPLGAILANAQAAQRLLDARRPNRIELKEALNDVVTAERRAAAYIAKVRALFKQAELSAEALEVAGFLATVAALTKPALTSRDIVLRVATEPTLPMVMGDRVGLEQAMLNLISNAADALAEAKQPDRRIEVRAWLRDPRWVGVAVTDYGKGIEPATLARIFQPLFTTKAAGTGMGLVIVRSIIEAHGSQVSVRSEHRKGTTFEFALPIA